MLVVLTATILAAVAPAIAGGGDRIKQLADTAKATTQSSNTTVLAAPTPGSPMTLEVQAVSAKVAPSGQAAFRAIAETGTQVSGMTFTATLPAGVTYNRTLGVALNNEAATNTITTTATTVKWANIASTSSVLPVGGAMEVVFVVNAPSLPGSFAVSVTAAGGGGSPTATDSKTVTVTNSALTLELVDSPFSVADSNDRGKLIPRVSTIGVRVVNPTLSSITANVNIGDGTTPGTFPGASGTSCTSITGGMAMLALEKRGAAGAAADATRNVTVPAGQTKTVFYSLCYPGAFFQRHAYVVWSNAAGTAPANGAAMTQSNLSASANKITSVSGGRLGDTITLTVNFNLGTIGALGQAWMQPAGTYAFDPSVSRLRTAQVTLNSTTQPLDRLYFVGLTGSISGTVTYTFDVIGFGNTTLSPYILAASGQPLKFTGNFGDSQTILTPPNLTAAKEQRNYPNGAFTTGSIAAGAGDVIEYRLTIANTGEQTATNVDVSDPIPALTTYVPGSASQGGALNGNSVEWLDKTVGPAAQLVLIFRVQVNATVPLTFQISNQASVTSDNGGSPQTNVVLANGQGVVDLGLTKTCPTTAVLGESASYTLGWSNSGTTHATGVSLTDTLGAGQTYASASGDYTSVSVNGNVVTFSLGSVSAGASGTITLTVTVTAPGTMSNSASIAGDQSEFNTSNNTASCSSPVTQPDLYIAKSCPASATPGETVTHTLAYGNSGSAAATGASITDVIGAGQTYVSGSASAPVSQNGNVLTFTLSTVPAGATGQITYSVVVASAAGAGQQSFSDTASIQGVRQEVVTANNISTCNTTVTFTPDLQIAKSTSDTGVTPGSTIAYTITVTNPDATSSAAATGVVVTDTLPEHTAFASCAGAPCSESDGVVTWNAGTVEVDETITLSLTVLVETDAGCEICNTATVSSPSDPDSPVASDPVCIGIATQGNPAGANASGGSYGLDAFLLGERISVPGVLDLPVAAAASERHGPGNDVEANNHFQDVTIPGLVAADTFVTTSSSSIDGAERTSHEATTSSVANLNLLDGAITADAVRAVVQTDATDGSAGVNAIGSTFTNLRVNGEQITDVTPNKRVALYDGAGGYLGYAVLFEQVVDVVEPEGDAGGAYAANLTVNMIHVYAGGPLDRTEIIVSHAQGSSDFPQAQRCANGAMQSASAHSYSMRALLGDGVEIAKGEAGPIPSSGGSAHQNLADLVTPFGTIDAATSDAHGVVGERSSTDAFDRVSGLVLLDGLIRASALDSRAHSEADGTNAASNADGTTFVDLLVGDVPVAHMPEPNTMVLDLPGIGFVTLNEQSTQTDGGEYAEQTVTAIHVFVTTPGNELGLAPGAEIFVSRARTSATHRPVAPNHLETV